MFFVSDVEVKLIEGVKAWLACMNSDIGGNNGGLG